MGRRTKGSKGRYLVHAGRERIKRVGLFGSKHIKKGQIIDNVSRSRSLAMDRKSRSKRVVKPGYGHLGDLVIRKRRKDGVRQRYHIRRKAYASDDNNKCYRCGGKVKYYDGALGYEAMVCQKCGHHYTQQSKEEFDRDKEAWFRSKRLVDKNFDDAMRLDALESYATDVKPFYHTEYFANKVNRDIRYRELIRAGYHVKKGSSRNQIFSRGGLEDVKPPEREGLGYGKTYFSALYKIEEDWRN